MSDVTIYRGDCRFAMEQFIADNSVDAVVTDPPYGLAFMGKRWDYDVPSTEIWAECLRVLKPGGHLLAFAGTRTQHRMAVRIEDAGFEIRDMIAWVYGSGFPKSHNLDGEWEGWGTALKPALEPITMARKPLVGTVAENVLTHGTGALNINECRVAGLADRPGTTPVSDGARNSMAGALPRQEYAPNEGGRWPANLIHDGGAEVLAAFPSAPGQIADASTSSSRKTQNVYGAMRRGNGRDGEASAGSDNRGAVGFKMRPGARREDAGSAARFFYCAKASRADRDDGMNGFDAMRVRQSGHADQRVWDILGSHAQPKKNYHPTVKPTDLMRYLCRLVTPPGGAVLDPFMGSGSTGRAAVMEGFKFIGIERDEAYVVIARARIEAATERCA